MLMMEIHSVKYYWHMNHDISDDEGIQSGGVIGDEWKNLIFNILAGIS